jgi:hypothetical protein
VSTGPAGPAPRTPTRGRFEDRPGHLLAEVDLSVEVTDVRGRRTRGRLVGTGHRLRMDVDDPAVAIAATGRGATRMLGSRLADAGIRAELHSRRGRVARVDPGRTSRLGGLLAGSPHVILDGSGWRLVGRGLLPGRRAVLLGSAIVGVALAVAGIAAR